MLEKDVLEKAINQDVQLQGITAVVPVEILPTLTTWLYMWLMPREVLRFLITSSWEMEYKQESLLTAFRFVGIFPYVVKDAVAKARTTLNGPGGVVVVGPFAVTRRLIWTWSMTVNDNISQVCLEVTYDPAIGLVVRVTFQCIFWQMTPEKKPTLEMWELIPSNSTADCTLETLWDWVEPETVILSWQMVQESPDHGTLIQVNVLANPSWTRITAFDCIKIILKNNNNYKPKSKKQHRTVVNRSKVEQPVSYSVESKLTKLDYLKLSEPWVYKRTRRNDCNRIVYSLIITNSKFQGLII
ncbi:uncharacterized protein LOC112685402 [Sipha flava]|uniref:Uncharacterized protein LOC112685402 n=1 Tax=Sipha flava TaxID=143950 RepID=A0A2S2QF08_9HEMI|nr:uncharacterized protein LOC112685402 [Sipha flava]